MFIPICEGWLSSTLTYFGVKLGKENDLDLTWFEVWPCISRDAKTTLLDGHFGSSTFGYDDWHVQGIGPWGYWLMEFWKITWHENQPFLQKKSLGMIPENKLHVWFLRESKFLWSSLVSLVQLCASFVISVASIWVWEAYLMLEFFPDNRDLILERSVKGGLSGQLRKVKSVSRPAEWFSFELICSMRLCPDVHWWFMMIFDSFLICRCIVSLWNMS